MKLLKIIDETYLTNGIKNRTNIREQLDRKEAFWNDQSHLPGAYLNINQGPLSRAQCFVEQIFRHFLKNKN